MSRRTWIVAAAGVVVAGVAVTLVVVLSGSDGSGDPNETAVTDLCRAAAESQPAMTEGVQSFELSSLTHEVDSGITFYEAFGTATTSDGFGGEESYRFQCRTKQIEAGAGFELLDITLL